MKKLQYDLFDTKCRNFARSSAEIHESLLDAANTFDCYKGMNHA
jgi:hypothetical protein